MKGLLSHLIFSIGLWASLRPADGESLVNEDVKRSIDLGTHLAKITADLTLSNSGPSPASSFILALEPGLENHLAYIGVTLKYDDEEESSLALEETRVTGQSGKFFKVKLGMQLAAGAKVKLALESMYTHVLRPFPTHIAQAEKQFVVFEGNHYFYSPYPTKTQTTRIKLASKNIESYTKLGNPSKSEDSVDYGPFKDIDAFSQDLLKLHYENNSPFLAIVSMTRLIEVSHWGNIAVEETIDLKHCGAVLKGPNIHVDTPYEINRQPDELHYTYLDTFGRPVIIAHKSNLVEQHIQDIVVHYTFNKILMLQEPLLVVGAFYILFFTVIIYVRLDFSITKDPAAEARMKVASITEQVLTLVNKRLGLYRHFEEAVNKYKQSRDVGTLNSGRKALETEHRALSADISALQSKLKAEGSDLAEKVAEIQKLDGQVKDLALKASQEAERLVAGKVKKDTYIENDKHLTSKRQDLVSRIDTILDTL
ncbi:hypothetical protein scyTo_0012063 [Scyliorhinus torazame]|uniref:Dolichyl-diphosphooligosaccharide--protein glycosyltransferase subunit 1 n=1 Tax=Scyliorhinus torazame TaxID=75743 RepID=A0A401P183_SCYTO|nr:hypothetical protein [Scyliorhinus torazame]